MDFLKKLAEFSGGCHFGNSLFVYWLSREDYKHCHSLIFSDSRGCVCVCVCVYMHASGSITNHLNIYSPYRVTGSWPLFSLSLKLAGNPAGLLWEPGPRIANKSSVFLGCSINLLAFLQNLQRKTQHGATWFQALRQGLLSLITRILDFYFILRSKGSINQVLHLFITCPFSFTLLRRQQETIALKSSCGWLGWHESSLGL